MSLVAIGQLTYACWFIYEIGYRAFSLIYYGLHSSYYIESDSVVYNVVIIIIRFAGLFNPILHA